MLSPFTTLDYFSPSSLKGDPGSFEAQAIQLPNPRVLSVNPVPGLPSTPAPSQNFSSLVAKEPTPHLSVSAPFPVGPLSTPPRHTITRLASVTLRKCPATDCSV